MVHKPDSYVHKFGRTSVLLTLYVHHEFKSFSMSITQYSNVWSREYCQAGMLQA